MGFPATDVGGRMAGNSEPLSFSGGVRESDLDAYSIRADIKVVNSVAQCL